MRPSDFHGNAASRAAPFRISTYQALSNRLNVNVVAVDYRGFADSNGVPSEKGLVRDAHAAWDWVLARREGTIDEKTSGISIMAQSLGTGVAAQLGRELAEKGTSGA